MLFSLAVLADVASARVIDVPLQAVSPSFADTEVSTNLVIHPSRTDVREVKIHLQLIGTEYNDLEIGFGRDVNTNGVLDVEEIETVYGWRGGRYFIENVRGWERIETEAANNDRRGVIDIHLTHGPDFMPKSFEATCGGEVAFAEFSTKPPPVWLFRNNWNMARVVRRGVGTSGEWVRCEVEYASFFIILR